MERTGECQHCGNCCRLLKGMDCYPTWLEEEFFSVYQDYVAKGRNKNYCYFYDHDRAADGQPACRRGAAADAIYSCKVFPATPEQVAAYQCPGFRFG